jgi:hypothetical protein
MPDENYQLHLDIATLSEEIMFLNSVRANETKNVE